MPLPHPNNVSSPQNKDGDETSATTEHREVIHRRCLCVSVGKIHPSLTLLDMRIRRARGSEIIFNLTAKAHFSLITIPVKVNSRGGDLKSYHSAPTSTQQIQQPPHPRFLARTVNRPITVRSRLQRERLSALLKLQFI